jgi:YidC/Oxa1 family membrane protein insertase
MKFLFEIVNFYRFFSRTSLANKKIVFYAENENYYPNFEGLIKELLHKGLTICYITSSITDPILRNSNSQIKTFYINTLLPFFMIFVKCKIFIMTLTDLNQFYLKRSINKVHYIYIFHSLVSTHMMYLAGAFDYYDTIFCVGPYQEKEICKYEELFNLPKKKLIKAGYYRLERIYEQHQKYFGKRDFKTQKLVILIAPSWGKGNILESCGEKLVKLLLKSGYRVIVRPHPETMRRSPGLINKLAELFGQNTDFTLERSVSSDESLLKADVLICDCSGVALEYAFGTERPVLFLDVPYKIRNKKYKKLNLEPLELYLRTKIGVVISPKNLTNMPNIIKKLMADRFKYKKRLVKLRNDNVYHFGNSSKIGVQCLIRYL